MKNVNSKKRLHQITHRPSQSLHNLTYHTLDSGEFSVHFHLSQDEAISSIYYNHTFTILSLPVTKKIFLSSWLRKWRIF